MICIYIYMDVGDIQGNIGIYQSIQACKSQLVADDLGFRVVKAILAHLTDATN